MGRVGNTEIQQQNPGLVNTKRERGWEPGTRLQDPGSQGGTMCQAPSENFPPVVLVR